MRAVIQPRHSMTNCACMKEFAVRQSVICQAAIPRMSEVMAARGNWSDAAMACQTGQTVPHRRCRECSAASMMRRSRDRNRICRAHQCDRSTQIARSVAQGEPPTQRKGA